MEAVEVCFTITVCCIIPRKYHEKICCRWISNYRSRQEQRGARGGNW